MVLMFKEYEGVEINKILKDEKFFIKFLFLLFWIVGMVVWCS